MGWPSKKEDEKEKQIELKPGEEQKVEKTPAELIADGFKSINDRITDFESKVDGRFTEYEGKFVSKPAKAESDEHKAEDKKISVFDNEDLAISQRLAPLAVETLNTRFELMYDRASRTVQDEIGTDAWKQIEPDVRKMLDSCENPLLRSNPVYIQNTINMIVGQKLRSGVRFDNTGKRFFLEDANAASEGGKHTPGVEEGLSNFPKTRARQLKAMKSFGLTPEEYRKSLGDLEVVSDV